MKREPTEGKVPSVTRAVRVTVKVPAYYRTKRFAGVEVTLTYYNRRMSEVRPFDDAEMHVRASFPNLWRACDWSLVTFDTSEPFTETTPRERYTVNVSKYR